MSSRRSRKIAEHIEKLGSQDKSVSVRAEHTLIRYYRTDAVDQLIAACSNPNPTVRFRAAWALGMSRDPKAYETILALLKDPDEAVAYDATIALGHLQDERAIPVLCDILNDDDSFLPAGAALYLFDPKVVPLFEAMLATASEDGRMTMLNVAGGFAKDFGDQRSRKLLYGFLSSPVDLEREEALFWLRETTDLVQLDAENLAEYMSIPISFEVKERLGRPDNVEVSPSYLKDYDLYEEERPDRKSKQFDTAAWGFLAIRHEGKLIAGATIACKTPDFEILEGRKNLAYIIDFRVAPEWRSKGFGRDLWGAVENWCRTRRMKELRVETQDINVPACRFYEAMGCQILSVDESAYGPEIMETQIIWSKLL